MSSLLQTNCNAVNLPCVKSASSRAFDRLRVTIAVVLAAAAALKAHQIAVIVISPGELAEARFGVLSAFVVTFEMVLAALMASNLHPRLGRRLSLGAFAAFAFMALQQVLAGRPSCGCFGDWAVPPGIVMLLDIAFIAALVCIKPPAVTQAARSHRVASISAFAHFLPRSWSGWSCVAIAVFLFWTAILSNAGFLQAMIAQASGKPLRLVSIEGGFHDGEAAVFRVKNFGSRPVALIGARPGSPLITVHGVPANISPNEECRVEVTLKEGAAALSRKKRSVVLYSDANGQPHLNVLLDSAR